MEIQEIDVFVAPDGTVKLQVRGVQGGGCLSLTEGLEKLLGCPATMKLAGRRQARWPVG
jgi:hypothetical protein